MRMMREEKQVGILYHFTSLVPFTQILASKGLKSRNNEFISFTRNFDLTKYSGDFETQKFRLTFDGTAMSNQFKIEPFLDPEYGVTRRNGEYEERVIWPKGKILPCFKYLLQIDINTRIYPPELPDQIKALGIPLKISLSDLTPYKK
jgi:hypothetical protein